MRRDHQVHPGRRTAGGAAVLLAVAGVGAAAAVGAASATPAASSGPGLAVPRQSMTQALPQDVRVSVSGRRVTVHFGSLRRRAVRTATVRFSRTSGSAVVRRTPASGIYRTTAPSRSRSVRVSLPPTQEWTRTTITRRIPRG